MNAVIENLRTYLREALNIQVKIYPWVNTNTLPVFLIDSYEFYKFAIFKRSCVLMIPKEGYALTPGLIDKHYKQVQKNCNDFIIYVQSNLSSYDRKRLVEHDIPFIIPRNQMYLPHLGIDFREHFRKLHEEKRPFFSPATQAIVIYALVRQTEEKLTSTLLVEKLTYSLMTVNRAFAELKMAEIGEFCQEGKERWWTFSNKRTLWDQAHSFLRSPVKKHVWLKKRFPKIAAGLTALSQISSLAPPVLEVYAISYRQWEIWKNRGVKELPSKDDAEIELEIWQYDPILFARDNIVDPFSLYLSLNENQDERIESALEEMMEKIIW